jgi:hypothetical protein
VFDDLVKHAEKVEANLAVTESLIFFLCAIAIAPPRDLRASKTQS